MKTLITSIALASAFLATSCTLLSSESEVQAHIREGLGKSGSLKFGRYAEMKLKKGMVNACIEFELGSSGKLTSLVFKTSEDKKWSHLNERLKSFEGCTEVLQTIVDGNPDEASWVVKP